MGKTGSAVVGRALLSNTLIQLSADGWVALPSSFCPEVTQPWGLHALWSGWWRAPRGFTPRRTFPARCCQCPHPCGEPLPTHASTGDPPTPAASFGSVLCWVAAPFLWVFVCARFCSCLPSLESLFPPSPVIKSRWPSRPDSLGIPSPFVRSLGWGAWGVVQNLHNSGELLWNYCSPVCGSPNWRVWDLILWWFCPSYCIASSLSLDVGCLFLVGSSILLSMVVQQLVVILVLWQEMSAHLFTPLSWTGSSWK